MKYTGIIGFGEEWGKVTDCIITEKNITADIDLKEDGKGIMKLVSTDGKNFSGTFTYNVFSRGYISVECKLYSNDDARAMVGKWIENMTTYYFSVELEST
ncbi:MAG: hypothetical protein ACFHWX_18500 [Bacteroidota bacterium]